MTTTIDIRRWYFPDCTLGRATCGNFHFFTLELPDLGNRQDISCIPPGRYSAFKRNSPSNGLCIELRDVPGRTFVQIHIGNFTRNIRGCILPGMSITHLDNDGVPDVGNSAAALNRLLSILPDDGIEVIIH